MLDDLYNYIQVIIMVLLFVDFWAHCRPDELMQKIFGGENEANRRRYSGMDSKENSIWQGYIFLTRSITLKD